MNRLRIDISWLSAIFLFCAILCIMSQTITLYWVCADGHAQELLAEMEKELEDEREKEKEEKEEREEEKLDHKSSRSADTLVYNLSKNYLDFHKLYSNSFVSLYTPPPERLLG